MGKAEKMNCDTLFKALHMPENPPPDWCKDNPWLNTLKDPVALFIFEGFSISMILKNAQLRLLK